MSMIERCPEQFRRRYIEGERVPPDLGLIRGRAVDQAVNANLSRRVETGEWQTLEEVADAAAGAVSSETSTQEWTPGDAYEDIPVKEAIGYVTDEVVALSTTHAQDVAPGLRPMLVQATIETEPDSLIPVPLVGVVDLVEANHVLRDLKTRRTSPPSNTADRSTQLTVYSSLYRAVRPEGESKLALDFVWRTAKTHKMGTAQQVTERTEDDLVRLSRRFEMAVRLVDAEIFPPTKEDNPLCSERFCGYARTCPFYRRGPERPKT